MKTILWAAIISGVFAIASCGSRPAPAPTPEPKAEETDMADNTIQKSEEEWKQELSSEEYHVLRQQGTERAFSGKYHDTKTPGVYKCAGCGQPVFSSEDKFDSGTGWPSYTQPVSSDAVETEEDRSLGMMRTEVHCSRCGGHLGHVFPDGPEPTGQRYCINSVSLDLEEKQ